MSLPRQVEHKASRGPGQNLWDQMLLPAHLPTSLQVVCKVSFLAQSYHTALHNRHAGGSGPPAESGGFPGLPGEMTGVGQHDVAALRE